MSELFRIAEEVLLRQSDAKPGHWLLQVGEEVVAISPGEAEYLSRVLRDNAQRIEPAPMAEAVKAYRKSKSL